MNQNAIAPPGIKNTGDALSTDFMILEYRLLYDQIKPSPYGRADLMRTLNSLVERYSVFLIEFQNKIKINEKKLADLQIEADYLLKQKFSTKVYNRFITSPKAIGLVHTDGLARQIVTDLASRYLYNITDTEKERVRHQFNYLNKIKQCLEDFGLHPAIQQRDVDTFKRYNIVVDYTENRKVDVACLTLLSKHMLQENYLSLFQQRRQLIINGASIPYKNIKKITVTTTLLRDEEIKYFKEKYRLQSDIELARKCNNESSELVDPLVHIEKLQTKKDWGSFISKMIAGIEQLQKGGDRHLFIKKVRDKKEYNEGQFRDYFEIFLNGGEYEVHAESLQREGRCDLRAVCKQTGTHIVEFKIWRGHNVADIARQITGYLTDFEPIGYIFLVNPNKSDILSAYKKMVTENDEHYVQDSWKQIKVPNKAYKYYESRHKYGNKVKTIYHFIYRLNP